MECLNQLFNIRVQPTARGGNETGEQSQEQDQVFILYRQTRLGFRTTKDSGYA